MTKRHVAFDDRSEVKLYATESVISSEEVGATNAASSDSLWGALMSRSLKSSGSSQNEDIVFPPQSPFIAKVRASFAQDAAARASTTDIPPPSFPFADGLLPRDSPASSDVVPVMLLERSWELSSQNREIFFAAAEDGVTLVDREAMEDIVCTKYEELYGIAPLYATILLVAFMKSDSCRPHVFSIQFASFWSRKLMIRCLTEKWISVAPTGAGSLLMQPPPMSASEALNEAWRQSLRDVGAQIEMDLLEYTLVQQHLA